MILHISEQWCDENPEIGPTNSDHNLYSTFQRCRKEKFSIIRTDAAEIIYQTHIDNIVLDYVKKFNIKIIFISLVNGSKRNPSFETFKKLKELGCYLIFHWPDAGNSFGSQTIKQLGSLADLHALWDNGLNRNGEKLVEGDNILRLFVPQDATLYFRDNQTIPASFMGSTRGYWDREILLKYIRGHFPQIHVGGGQREESISPFKYAEIIRRSKIGINYSNSLANCWQIKGRVYEILASGSMLFEMKNPATESILKPDFDYIDFSSPKEMIEKLQYYLTHDEERQKIANQGYETYQKHYTAQHFWDTIMSRVYKDLNEKGN